MFIVIVLSEFEEWKEKIQLETNTNWSKYSTDTKFKITYFRCNRSGKPVIKFKDRQKDLKGLCTVKTDSECCSYLTHSIRDGKHCVSFCTAHSSHLVETEFLRVSKSTKDAIQSKLVEGFPVKEIIRQIRMKTSEEYGAAEYVTRKDIENIIEKYSIGQVYKLNDDDGESVDQFVQKDIIDENSSVILYKPMGIGMPNTKTITESDFLLAIMNEEQRNFLRKAMSSPPGILCVDATHGTNAYGFQLITLMSVNSFGNGVPCAFLFSTKENQEALGLFFSAIKQVVGHFEPKVFMSDDASAYWNAFEATMSSTNTKRLLCSWHVDRAWRKKLQQLSVDVQPEVYQQLCLLRLELDKEKFKEMMANFITICSKDKRTKTFARYFQKKYAKRSEY